MKRLNTPLDAKIIGNLKIGDEVFLSGIIYTCRDQAHKRMVETLAMKGVLPFDIRGQVIYYCGPTRAPQGRVIGSCGPTTSNRMDEFVEPLLEAGLKGMVGKGSRSEGVIKAIRKHKAVYFLTFAGCGALLSRYVKKATCVAYKDLGPEGILRLEVEDFPLIVAVDCQGGSIYG